MNTEKPKHINIYMTKSKYLFTLILLLSFMPGFTQTIKFNSNKECKIIQFTDIHYKSGSPRNSGKSLKMMDYVLDRENPEIVIFTGDIVTGDNIRQGWKDVLKPVVSRNIPFAVTLGNHDDESNMSVEEIYGLLSSYPLCLNRGTEENNYDDIIKVVSSDSEETKALLYLFYSNAYSTLNDIKGYGWIKPEQVANYNNSSRNLTTQNSGRPLPSLAFLHIPLPEYGEAYNNNKESIGVRLENECSPAINTGLFASMKINGDVMGVFCGHDHNNDYLTSKDGIALAYGRFSGSKNTYTDLKNGARIITIKENCHKFYTKLILNNGEIINETSFPASNIKAMSFNIRYDNSHDGDNSWKKRRNAVVKTIVDNDIDLLGTQELLDNQLQYLRKELNGYSDFGIGRIDGMTKGEYASVFYKKDRFTLLDSGNFWLSENPEATGIKGWDAACERIATWVLLKDKRTNEEIFFLNTHFDHIGKTAQHESAGLIKNKIKELSRGNKNIIITGDFNISPDNPAIAELLKEERTLKLVNTSKEYKEGPTWTFHNFGKIEESRRSTIDYIFVNDGASVINYSVIFNAEERPYISDHAPVVSEIIF